MWHSQQLHSLSFIILHVRLRLFPHSYRRLLTFIVVFLLIFCSHAVLFFFFFSWAWKWLTLSVEKRARRESEREREWCSKGRNERETVGWIGARCVEASGMEGDPAVITLSIRPQDGRHQPTGLMLDRVIRKLSRPVITGAHLAGEDFYSLSATHTHTHTCTHTSRLVRALPGWLVYGTVGW